MMSVVEGGGGSVIWGGTSPDLHRRYAQPAPKPPPQLQSQGIAALLCCCCDPQRLCRGHGVCHCQQPGGGGGVGGPGQPLADPPPST